MFVLLYKCLHVQWPKVCGKEGNIFEAYKICRPNQNPHFKDLTSTTHTNFPFKWPIFMDLVHQLENHMCGEFLSIHSS